MRYRPLTQSLGACGRGASCLSGASQPRLTGWGGGKPPLSQLTHLPRQPPYHPALQLSLQGDPGRGEQGRASPPLLMPKSMGAPFLRVPPLMGPGQARGRARGPCCSPLNLSEAVSSSGLSTLTLIMRVVGTYTEGELVAPDSDPNSLSTCSWARGAGISPIPCATPVPPPRMRGPAQPGPMLLAARSWAVWNHRLEDRAGQGQRVWAQVREGGGTSFAAHGTL